MSGAEEGHGGWELGVWGRCEELQAPKAHLIYQPTGHKASSCWLAPRHMVLHMGHAQAGISTNTDWYTGHMDVDKHRYRQTHRDGGEKLRSLTLRPYLYRIHTKMAFCEE